jgi:hypothetical protein
MKTVCADDPALLADDTPDPRVAARKRQPIIEPVRKRHHQFAAAIEAAPDGRMYYPQVRETMIAMGLKPISSSKHMTMACRYLGCRRGQDATGKFIEKAPVAREATEDGDECPF